MTSLNSSISTIEPLCVDEILKLFRIKMSDLQTPIKNPCVFFTKVKLFIWKPLFVSLQCCENRFEEVFTTYNYL